MGYTVAEKIIRDHLEEGEMKPGAEIGIRVDQTLTPDATGTMVYLEFESLGKYWFKGLNNSKGFIVKGRSFLKMISQHHLFVG